MLLRLRLVEQAQAELDQVIADACRPWQHQIELLQTIPGVGEKIAQVIVAETGADMSRFPTASHLAAWAGLAPAMHESAGKQTPAGKRRGNKWLAAMLVEAAGSVGRMHSKNYLAAQHARLTKRRGMGRAQVAVAHSILVAAYYMLIRDQPYDDLGRTGTSNATRKPTPAGSSPNWRSSATPSSSTQRPDHEASPPASGVSARRCRSMPVGRVIHGSVGSPGPIGGLKSIAGLFTPESKTPSQVAFGWA